MKKNKHLDFEINLIPCIDLLSVCICFLLLTAVWLNVGSMNVKQAVGGQSAAETEKKPLLWVFMGAGGQLNLDLQQSSLVPAGLRK
jgi:biopolymer transport protein ExbD